MKQILKISILLAVFMVAARAGYAQQPPNISQLPPKPQTTAPAKPKHPAHRTSVPVFSAKPVYDFTETTNNLNLKMVGVQGGTFTMGCTGEQGSDCGDNEKPAHQVTLSSYYIGKYEVTQAQWKAVMGSNPSDFKGDDLPVESVSWNGVQQFITKLNAATGKRYRLPTEAEWEYAARGGAKSQGYKYSGSNNVYDVAWHFDNSNKKTHPVGTQSPNELGIYDMSGNVWEWCLDWHGDYPSTPQRDPVDASSGSRRVLRGGSWDFIAQNCRVSYRGDAAPIDRLISGGFRLVLVP